jgi:hypothetical protein
MRISCPSSLMAWGSALDTSAKPPVFAKGSTSLDKNKTFSGLDIELHFQKIDENQVNLPKFYQIRNQKKRACVEFALFTGLRPSPRCESTSVVRVTCCEQPGTNWLAMSSNFINSPIVRLSTRDEIRSRQLPSRRDKKSVTIETAYDDEHAQQKRLDSLPDGFYIASQNLSGKGEFYSGFVKG